jgi:hypothetical protein
MGLDITVYNNLKFIGNKTLFKGKKKDKALDTGKLLIMAGDFDRLDNIKEGWYTCDEVFSFRAGSYSEYTKWRTMLSEIMLGESVENILENLTVEDAFVPLISFSDCEGFIGPLTSSKLYSNFTESRQYALNSVSFFECNWFMEKYDNWTTAFKLASNNGVVEFN